MTESYNPVGWFEIPVSNMARAKVFYEKVFCIQLESHQMGDRDMAWFPMTEQSIGASGSLVKGDGYTPSADGILIYFTTPDLDGTIKRTEPNGGVVLQGRTSIGEYGFLALVQDTEGNKIGLHCR